MRQEFGHDADARVRDLDARLTVLAPHAHAHAPAARRELHRVREQIPHDLLQPERRALHDERAGGQLDRQLYLARGRLGADGLGREPHHGAEVYGLPLDAELARDDARDVEQVVHEPRLKARVALDGVEPLREHLRVGGRARAQEVDPPEHGRQRRPQLVREGGEEDVLHAVGLDQLAVDAAQLGRPLLDAVLQPAVQLFESGARLALGEHQAAVLDAAPHGVDEFGDDAGLGEVVVGAVAQRGDGRLDRGEAGEDDDDGERGARAHLLQQREAVALVHVQVGQDEVVVGAALQVRDGLAPARSHVHLVAFEAQHLADREDDVLLVVHDQQPRGRRGRVERCRLVGHREAVGGLHSALSFFL